MSLDILHSTPISWFSFYSTLTVTNFETL
jgi:hypothetical protein